MTTMTALLSALLAAAPAGPLDAFLAAQGLPATEVKAVPTSPTAAAWDAIAETRVRVATQRTVRLNDARANEALKSAGVPFVSVRVAASEAELAVLLEWADATRDVVSTTETDTYADSAAIEFPVRFGAGQRLP
jgi:DMSO reductase family type II enzyme heme b subunit